jgi:hypothetical protein
MYDFFCNPTTFCENGLYFGRKISTFDFIITFAPDFKKGYDIK